MEGYISMTFNGVSSPKGCVIRDASSDLPYQPHLGLAGKIGNIITNCIK